MKRGHDHFIIFRDDAGTWCAAPPNFEDLMRHPTGLGSTKAEAIDDLLCDSEFLFGVSQGDWPMPRPVDFVEVPEPEGAKMTVAYDRETQTLTVKFGSNPIATERRATYMVISNG